MVTQRTIEFVDTLNRVGGVASIAKLVGENYLKKIGAVGYWTKSSGSHVDAIEKGDVPFDFMVDMIDKARKKGGIFQKHDSYLIDKAIEEGNSDVLSQYYQRAEAIFQEEPNYTLDVFRNFDIKGGLKEMQEQTVARPDTLCVFAMSELDSQKVQDIYCNSDYRPNVIEVLWEYARVRKNVRIVEPFGLDGERHIKSVEQLLKYVPKAIDRLLREQ